MLERVGDQNTKSRNKQTTTQTTRALKSRQRCDEEKGEKQGGGGSRQQTSFLQVESLRYLYCFYGPLFPFCIPHKFSLRHAQPGTLPIISTSAPILSCTSPSQSDELPVREPITQILRSSSPQSALYRHTRTHTHAPTPQFLSLLCVPPIFFSP